MNEHPVRARQPNEEQWTTSRWLESIDLGRHVAKSLLRPLRSQFDTAANDLSPKELAYLCALADVGSPKEIKNLLANDDLLSGLAIQIWDAMQDLASQGASTSFELQQKFQQEPNTFILAYSGLETYFNGLEGFLGPPSPDVRRQMDREHRECPDSHASYEASNYGTMTTAHVEWMFVVSPTDEALRELGLAEWPLESKLHSRPSKQRFCRKPTPLRTFSEEITTRNSQLTSIGHAPMLEEEIIGARLVCGWPCDFGEAGLLLMAERADQAQQGSWCGWLSGRAGVAAYEGDAECRSQAGVPWGAVRPHGRSCSQPAPQRA